MTTPKQQEAIENRELNRIEERKALLNTLHRHNQQILEKHLTKWFRQDMSNGILCDDCGHELYDTGRGTLDFPPSVMVKCPNCRAMGKRYLSP